MSRSISIPEDKDRRKFLALAAAGMGAVGIGSFLAGRSVAAPGDAINGTTISNTDIDAQRIAGIRIATEFDTAKHAGTDADPWNGAAIQGAIDDLPAGGGMVLVPAGSYNCVETLDLSGTPRTQLLGVGLPKLDFAGAAAGSNSIAFVAVKTDYVTVAGLHIVNSRNVGIIGNGDNCVIRDCVVETSSLQGINLQGDDSAILDNIVDGTSTEFGIVIGGPVNRFLVRGNRVLNATWDGIEWGYTGRGVIITENVLQGNRDGIAILAQPAGAVDNQDALIAKNLIIAPGQNGITVQIQAAGPALLRPTIEDNVIISPTQHGIRVRDAQDATVRGNVILDPTLNGIFILSPATRVRVMNNYVRNAAQHAAQIDSDGHSVKGNLFDTTTFDGIVMPIGNTFTNLVIHDNTFRAIGRDSMRNHANGNQGNVRGNRGSFITGVLTEGVAAITVTASPFTYTNNDGVAEAVYIDGGTVSAIAKNAITIYTSTGKMVWLEPGEAVVVTYSSAPTMNRDRK